MCLEQRRLLNSILKTWLKNFFIHKYMYIHVHVTLKYYSTLNVKYYLNFKKHYDYHRKVYLCIHALRFFRMDSNIHKYHRTHNIDWLQYSFSSQLLDSYPTKHQTNVFVYWCHVTVDAHSIKLLSTAHFDTAAPKAGGNAPNLFKGYACKSASPEEGYK